MISFEYNSKQVRLEITEQEKTEVIHIEKWLGETTFAKGKNWAG